MIARRTRIVICHQVSISLSLTRDQAFVFRVVTHRPCVRLTSARPPCVCVCWRATPLQTGRHCATARAHAAHAARPRPRGFARQTHSLLARDRRGLSRLPSPISVSHASYRSFMPSNAALRAHKSISTAATHKPPKPAHFDHPVNRSPFCFQSRAPQRTLTGPRSRRMKKKEKKPADEKRPRTAFTAEQLNRLKQEFLENR